MAVIAPDFPDISPSSWLYPDWAFPSALVFYNPFLTQVAYVSGKENNKLAVLDLMTQEQLWAGNVYSHPKWSPNGAYLAVITMHMITLAYEAL